MHEASIAVLQIRIAELENKVAFLMAHLGIGYSGPPAPAGMDEVAGLLRENKLIDAIKAYRVATGADLKTAKDAVEAMAAKLGVR